MTKIYCNLCGKELSPNSFPGGLMRNKELYPIIPGIQGVRDPAFGKQTMQEIWDLCEDCQKWIWEQVEKRQLELQTKESMKGDKKS